MYKNGISYLGLILLILLSHMSLLAIILFRGNYEAVTDVGLLAAIVLGTDLIYFCVLRLMRQATYTADFALVLLLNMSVIFQSCFGGVGFAFKHYLMAVGAFVFCQIAYLLTRDAVVTERRKPIYYVLFGVLMLSILLFTGSRGIWIDLGFITLQPSEFLKPVFVLLCATSISAQQNKKKALGFMIVRDNWYVYGCTVLIVLLQWWCRDLGSLPTFLAVAGCGLICRICYPRAKLSKKLIAGLCAGGAVLAAVAVKIAPAYVLERLHADIWKDPSGSGYQQCKALIAIAEGGWFGKGPGQGTLHKVAASNTDIVFSTICEEWGLLMALLSIFTILLILCTCLTNTPRSYYHACIVNGVVAVFVVQMTLNIFGSCNLIPFTGVTIPFISQGGSSMLTSGFLVGLLKATQSPLFHSEVKVPKKKKPALKKKRKATA
ncbi:FtsW/RodA/SpoVE family cell cycle protein [Ruminococcus champanellensis]